MHRLHTLGKTFLADESGEPLAGAATQRRTLALLATLAVAGNGGLSRDKLIGLLWPEVGAERARHSLTQGLYAARRALGIDGLFAVSGANIRLNFSELASDVRELEDALDAGDLERAAELYTGPFLDGFFLSGSAEFEQWSSVQRERLQARAADALERLAVLAEDAGDPRQALEWRRRLAALLPLDGGNAVKLMTAMAAVGDRAGAVQYARVHAALLRDQLDLDPDPHVEALANELRAPAPVPPADLGRDDAIAAPSSVIITDEPETPLQRPASLPSGVSPVRVWTPAQRARLRWQRLSVLGVIVVALVGIGVLVGRRGNSSRGEVQELAVRQRVVVAPFRVAGADASLAYLRDGMVELLSTRLADDTAARSVDAGAVLGAWRAAGLTSSMDVARDTVVKLATRLGAERVVVGSVVGTRARAVLSATVLRLPQGTVSGQASVAGPADSITALIDRLAARLLVSEAGQEESLAHYTSQSLPALQAFLAGQAAFRKNDNVAALRHYERALRRDSLFALAALYKALTADRLNLEIPLWSGLATAWESREDLNERDQSLLLAFVGPRYPALPTAEEQTAAWQHVVDLAPNSADAWHALGARLLKDGAAAGMQTPRTRAAAALQRALAAGGSGGSSAADLRAIAMASQYDGAAPDSAARVLALLRARSSSEAGRVDLLLAEHSLALNQGRASDALEATTRLRRLQPSTDAWLRLRVLDALYAHGDSAAAEDAARRLMEVTRATPLNVPTTWDGWLADACVVAQWRLARGDTTAVRGTIATLRARNMISASTLVAATPEACAVLLDASLAVTTRSRDARARVQRLDSLVFTPQVAGDASAYAPLVIARLFERLGDRAGALRAIRKRGYMTGWPRYLAVEIEEERRLAASR